MDYRMVERTARGNEPTTKVTPEGTEQSNVTPEFKNQVEALLTSASKEELEYLRSRIDSFLMDKMPEFKVEGEGEIV